MLSDEYINKELEKLEKFKGVKKSFVISKEGFLITGSIPRGADKDKVSAMIATLAGAGEQVLHELNDGELIVSTVDGKRMNITLTITGKDLLLVCITNKNANVKKLIKKMKKVSKQITEKLSG